MNDFPYSRLAQFLFIDDAATPEIYTLSLHDALPISDCYQYFCVPEYGTANGRLHSMRCTLCGHFLQVADRKSGSAGMPRPISYAVFCLKKKKIGTVPGDGRGRWRV